MALTLFIGHKNYSSWSMRPWVLLKQAGIEFTEVKLRFDSFDAGSTFKRKITGISPAGRVPVLEDDGFAIWDSLAISEYLAEKFPEKKLWPAQSMARARARSICAEMHSGFGALRAACPMNIEADLALAGQLICRDKPAVREDVSRISRMWLELLAGNKGQFLFGDFCIADAFFAPVCMRLKTYDLPVPPEVSAYIQRLSASAGVRAWIADALAERLPRF